MFGAVAACRAKHRRSAVRAEAPPRGGSQNSLRWLRSENICATRRPRRTKSRCRYLCRTKTVSWLRPAQLCELQNRRKPAVKQPHPPAPLRRQRIAESTTSLTRAVTLVTPGRLPLPGTKKGGRPNLPPFSLCGAMITECPARPSTWPPS